ncbi:MAG: glycosyltransferase family 4 protein [Lentisphaerae bacterium]|nr:glycosyltransferase family 4 protein [Lentisphaerota bacterium]
MAGKRFFYLVPKGGPFREEGENRLQYWLRCWRERGRQRPSGGVKVMYQHCDVLNRNGYTAIPVHVGGVFSVDWFPHESQAMSEATALRECTPNDIVICPEVIPAAATPFVAERKIAFVQGWSLVDVGLGERSYEDYGFTGLLACSQFNREYMEARSSLPCPVIRNGINLDLFHPPTTPPEPRRVLYVARKNLADALATIQALPQDVRSEITFVEHRGPSSEQEMADYYRSADIFLWTGYPEGFGLPPLEAMACGCAVIGFTGGGGNEFMKNGKTALTAPDGDVASLARQLACILQNEQLRETVRAGGTAIAQQYTFARMESDILAFAETHTDSERQPEAEETGMLANGTRQAQE